MIKNFSVRDNVLTAVACVVIIIILMNLFTNNFSVTILSSIQALIVSFYFLMFLFFASNAIITAEKERDDKNE